MLFCSALVSWLMILSMLQIVRYERFQSTQKKVKKSFLFWKCQRWFIRRSGRDFDERLADQPTQICWVWGAKRIRSGKEGSNQAPSCCSRPAVYSSFLFMSEIIVWRLWSKARSPTKNFHHCWIAVRITHSSKRSNCLDSSSTRNYRPIKMHWENPKATDGIFLAIVPPKSNYFTAK